MLDIKIVEDETCDYDLLWADVGTATIKLQKMQSHQRVNHYPGINELGHKNKLARNLNKMAKYFEKQYDFTPKTWILPQDFSDLKA